MYPIDVPELKIGRYYDNDIILQDIIVSRRHAKISKIGDKYIYKDQSTNGSYVNKTLLVCFAGLSTSEFMQSCSTGNKIHKNLLQLEQKLLLR